MLQIEKNKNLQPLHTFALPVRTKYFVEIHTEAELFELMNSDEFSDSEKMILGGGSNLLFTQNFPGIVIKIMIPGIKIIEENDDEVIVEAGAGDNWHELVKYAVNRGWGGIENLALIPGNIGTAPMQNIGAYGVEIKDVLHSLTGIDIATGEKKRMTAKECKFGYRDSIFKHGLKGEFIITAVCIRLSKTHKLNTSYGQVEAELNKLGKSKNKWTISDVADAVTNIRETKLPDPKKIGTAGSFFKNPIVSKQKVEKLQKEYPNIPSYPIDNPNKIKLSAGWLIDQAGWKGWIDEDNTYGVHEKHALVLVNHDRNTTNEKLGGKLWELAKKIRTSVSEKFGIQIEPEVNII